MKDEVDTFGRLQFYEFLDIIPYTTYIKDIDIPLELNDGIAKDNQKLYKIDNFLSFLHTDDERIRKQLDSQYRHIISRAISTEQGPKSTKREKLIEHTRQNELEVESRVSYEALKDALRYSNKEVSLSKGGKVLGENVSQCTTRAKLTESQMSQSDVETPTVVQKQKPLLEPIILKKDMEKQDALIEDLEWEMINNTEKYKISFRKKLDELKNRKKYRETRSVFSQPPSTAQHPPSDMFAMRPSRPSTVNDVFDIYSTFEEDMSFRTKLTSSGTIDFGDETDTTSEEQPVFRDITLDQNYQARKQILLEKFKLIKQGKRLVDL